MTLPKHGSAQGSSPASDPESVLRQFLTAHVSPDQRNLLVAVSGGSDSMALLAAAHGLSLSGPYRIFAAHLIHHPKSEEARERANQVADFCRRKAIPLAQDELDLSAADPGSPEERMRQGRYQFLETTAQQFACDWILTGHHADDQAETILLRILTGTGLRGLAGIPVKRGKFLRPFLTLGKHDLLNYCHERGVPFCEDPANRNLKTPRNRIRLRLLPLIRDELNPGIAAALNRLGRWAAEANEVIEQEVERCWDQGLRSKPAERAALSKDKIVLDIDALLPYLNLIQKHTLQKAINLAAGTEVALDAHDLDRALTFLQRGRSGALLVFPGGVRMTRKRRQLIITAGGEPSFGFVLTPGRKQDLAELNLCATWERVRSRPFKIGDGWVADLALGTDSNALILRPARQGDRFFALGGPGERRLSRFLADRGVSRLDKRRTWVLEHDGDIIWVVGHRISERVRVTQADRGAWRLALAPRRSVISREPIKKQNGRKKQSQE